MRKKTKKSYSAKLKFQIVLMDSWYIITLPFNMQKLCQFGFL